MRSDRVIALEDALSPFLLSFPPTAAADSSCCSDTRSPTQDVIATAGQLQIREPVQRFPHPSQHPGRIAMATSPSPASSAANSRHGQPHYDAAGEDDRRAHDDAISTSVSVETLVEHLLAAKRSLSSMTLVLRANDLSTHARQLHEESVILGAQAAFLRRGINDQTKLLLRVRRNMIRTYDSAKREFKRLLLTLDATNDKLENTMGMLRDTTVDPVFRPEGEEPKNLLDFVDENQVDGMRDALKANIGQLQVSRHLPRAQTRSLNDADEYLDI